MQLGVIGAVPLVAATPWPPGRWRCSSSAPPTRLGGEPERLPDTVYDPPLAPPAPDGLPGRLR
jgi:hypothetical protein